MARRAARSGNGSRQLGLALTLFTVLSYATTEEELSANVHTICQHINPAGYFFFDLPGTVFFNAGTLVNHHSPNLNRVVQLEETNVKDIYTYSETCNGFMHGVPFAYADEFQIRYWSPETLHHLLTENGMTDTLTTFPQFAGTGSTYKLYRKR